MIVAEGKARVSTGVPNVVSREMGVFYNPAMEFNRNVSVSLLKFLPEKGLRIADPLAASGVRSIRFLLELGKAKVKEVAINDASPAAAASIMGNLRLNGLRRDRRVTVANEEASIFLLKNGGFDYVDIDPFGSPVNFLDAAVRSLSRRGILAVTATDTAALSGTSPKACFRKYWAAPLRNFMMHEIGLRILIRRVQLAATSHDKALIPVYSYSKLHYMRAFFRCSYGKKDVDSVLKQQEYVAYCRSCFSTAIAKPFGGISCGNCKSRKIEITGPLWTGQLLDRKIAAGIADSSRGIDASFLRTIAAESKVNALGFFDTHFICKKRKLNVPPVEAVISKLQKSGCKAARTHFSGNGIRTTAPVAKFIDALKH